MNDVCNDDLTADLDLLKEEFNNERLASAKRYADMCRRAQNAEDALKQMEKRYRVELAENVRLRRMMEAMKDERD